MSISPTTDGPRVAVNSSVRPFSVIGVGVLVQRS
jgi:hypothetical protein